MKVSKYLPTIIVIILTAVPICIWLSMEPLGARFADLGATTTSFGQIAGLLGMMLFSINLILSNRSIFFDKIFRGLHIFYNHHKWLGVLSFCLLLFHPIFLVVKYLTISTYEAALFLLPGSNLPVTLGIVALLSMIILLGITIYLKIKYHIWRFSHKFMTLVFVIAILHTMFITSDISRSTPLRFYIFIFAFIGLAMGAYRAFFRNFFNKDFEFQVTKVDLVNKNVTEIEIEPVGRKLEFFPGQFIFIRFVGVGISSEPHPFSIASSTEGINLKIVIKSLGDYTSNMNKVTKGMIAKVEGPFGSFFKNRDDAKKEIWIAGGVGITPFLSLARSLKNPKNDIYLFYCTNDPVEAVFLQEFESIKEQNEKFHLVSWCSNNAGRINADQVAKTVGGLLNSAIYICGPLPFMRSLQEQFRSKGVEKSNINFEEFNFL